MLLTKQSLFLVGRNASRQVCFQLKSSTGAPMKRKVIQGFAARHNLLESSSSCPTSRPYFTTSVRLIDQHNDDDLLDSSPKDRPLTKQEFELPQRIRQKVISAEDAVSLIRDGDTVCSSGFVSQGAPEAVLKALGERYLKSGQPNNLTLLFGGGPGDWDKRGLNHLGQVAPEGSNYEPMLKRTIGSHYGQTPMIAKLALSEKVEAWSLPLGSVSRMIRSQSTHSPGHITSIGVGTYVDPASGSGGAINDAAANSPFHKELVTRLSIGGHDHLMYKALPINVAIIRGTTADGFGNISIEQESVNCDQMILAAAARNSGGLVIAQVKRLAADGSIPARNVEIPGPLVDCIVVVDDKDHDELHPMSYVERFNPALTATIRAPSDRIPKMPLSVRKLIARRAFFGLKPNNVTNLGIGLPEGVASVAAEEGLLEYITLTTEPGIFGGIPASGHSFGPAYNSHAMIEMNKMFDYYDGGGLDICFLGAAQISQSGDVNVSRMSKDRLTGPGGFIDITQPTKNICFLTPLTTNGLDINMPGNGTLEIKNEGKIKKFVQSVNEVTFSGDEAVRRGQKVYYVTERAVFRRSAKYDELELVEIAPGIDLQKDVLDQIDITPVISPDLKLMDKRIFNPARMNVKSDFFGNFEKNCSYHEHDHSLFIDLAGVTLNSEDDINWCLDCLKAIIDPLVKEKGPINAVVNYDGFDIRPGLEDQWAAAVEEYHVGRYKTVTRFAGKAFKRAMLGAKLNVQNVDYDSLFDSYTDKGDTSGIMLLERFREVMIYEFHLHLTTNELKTVADKYMTKEGGFDRRAFKKAIDACL